MQCPKCQFENPVQVKFCHKCGMTMQMFCDQCGEENALDSKFCVQCGRKFTHPSEPNRREISFDKKLTKIQKCLPEGIIQKISSRRDKIEGEHKQVTVMFCDMEGYTTLSEKIGAEDVYTLMDQVYEILIQTVHNYDGTVNEMTGDGIMALFGAPIALEDAPQCAIQSALAIHREINKFCDQLKSEKDMPSLRMRIGIHTGPVVVGTLGSDQILEFKAVGNTVNLASRMEGLAEPGTIYVTEDTFKLTEGFFRFESLGEKRVKGKEQPVKVYQVIAPSTRRTRFDVSAELGLTPFVGREKEFELLLEGFKRFKAGKGQAFSIVSEAGCGKSRLLYEFRKAVANEDLIFMEGKCVSYSKAIAYYPHIDILKSSFDIQEGDAAPEIKEKVRKGLRLIGADEASTLVYLLELLSVKDSGIDHISMSPEARKDRTIEATKQVVLKASETRPLIIAIEDLHWMDKSSEDATKSLLDSIEGSKVMLILTYRAEFARTWGVKPYHSQITLNRFSNQESLVVMTHLLNKKEIEQELENLILSKTEGNPFFIEEYIKSLKDLKIIDITDGGSRLTKDLRNISTPSTIQDVIMARVDVLPVAVKAVLQTGAVIGREFAYDLMKRVSGLYEQQLLSHLSILKDSELLYELTVYPKSIYIFKHAVTRDVVYDSILMKTRKRIHQEIGTAIEELYRDKIEEHIAALVNHFTVSENYRKVADYSQLACKKAEETMNMQDATEYAQKRLNALEALSQTEELQDEIIDARMAQGFYLFQLANMVEAKESIDPIVDAVIKRGLKDKIGKIYLILGICKYMAEEEFQESIRYLEKAIEITGETGDFETRLHANFILGLVLAFNCDFGKAIHHFDMLISPSMAVERAWLVSYLKSNISVYAYDYQGLVTQGYPISEEALRIAEKSGDIYSKAVAYACHGTSCYYRGRLEEAEKYLIKGSNLTEKIDLVAHNAVANQWLGHVYCDLGEYQKAQEHYTKAIYVRVQSRLAPSSTKLNRIALLRAKVLSGDKDINLELMYRYVRENKVRIYEGCMARYIGDILLHLDECFSTAAEKWIGKAIEADHRNRMYCDLGRDYALCGEFFGKIGQPLKAKEFFEKAIEIFKKCGADGWVQTTEKTLLKSRIDRIA